LLQKARLRLSSTDCCWKKRRDYRVGKRVNTMLRFVKNITYTLMFISCIIRRSRNNQHYALICTTLLFYILAPKCFGKSAIIRELHGSVWVTWNTYRIGSVSYNVWLRGLCVGVLWFHLLYFPAELGSTT
jgi:hypothetical protein